MDLFANINEDPDNLLTSLYFFGLVISGTTLILIRRIYLEKKQLLEDCRNSEKIYDISKILK